MDKMDIPSLIFLLVQRAVLKYPEMDAAFRRIFTKPNATADDWQAEHDLIAGMSYEGIVTNTQLPKT